MPRPPNALYALLRCPYAVALDQAVFEAEFNKFGYRLVSRLRRLLLCILQKFGPLFMESLQIFKYAHDFLLGND